MAWPLRNAWPSVGASSRPSSHRLQCAVHGLDRQQVDQRLQTCGCRLGDLLHLRPALGILQHGRQMRDQYLGMARIPLQGALEAWMVEIG
ncbi:hypothetical protein WR25_06804 [Diploscapter pachys]|uniref:Uncharacterized protein n=1 Tax=Diploscapter pachys TaxID=2018661 RepID=A0A2A2KME6_9BILA|nr:hypothetical protein WR25_06804 [Diploscapter pachys]